MTAKTKEEHVIRLSKIDDERRVTTPAMCKMHFIKQPMKVTKASKQYLYDDLGRSNQLLAMPGQCAGNDEQ